MTARFAIRTVTSLVTWSMSDTRTVTRMVQVPGMGRFTAFADQ